MAKSSMLVAVGLSCKSSSGVKAKNELPRAIPRNNST